MAVHPALTRQQPVWASTRRLEDAARQVAEIPLAEDGEIQLLCLDCDMLYYTPVDPARDLSAARREQLQAMLSAALGFTVRLVQVEEV